MPEGRATGRRKDSDGAPDSGAPPRRGDRRPEGGSIPESTTGHSPAKAAPNAGDATPRTAPDGASRRKFHASRAPASGVR